MTKKVELLPQDENTKKGDQEMKDVRICVLHRGWVLVGR